MKINANTKQIYYIYYLYFYCTNATVNGAPLKTVVTSYIRLVYILFFFFRPEKKDYSIFLKCSTYYFAKQLPIIPFGLA